MNGRAMLTVTTWNVNGIRAREPEVLTFIDRHRPDVLSLQEVKASPDQVPAALRDLDSYWCYWHGHKGYSGVALLLSRQSFPERPVFAHPEFDHETRIVTATLGTTVFTSVYVPNGGKDFGAKTRFLNALATFTHAVHAEGRSLVLVGDMNVAREERDVHPTLRRPTEIGQTPNERAQLEHIIGEGLVDLSRRFHPDADQLYTWWAPWRNMRARNIGWRLDYVLASAALAEHASGCEVFPEFGTSDHAPVMASFDVAPPKGAPTSEAGAPPGGATPPTQTPPGASTEGQLKLF
ncbi:exodeoxyribonuclease III [Pendulispora albinea]|uniref:Exodeoxyribonuclease III n=1 Tax=Pendulispora albinea TaxID=2741071 RepID=A0ABZ2LYT6_9BACT